MARRLPTVVLVLAGWLAGAAPAPAQPRGPTLPQPQAPPRTPTPPPTPPSATTRGERLRMAKDEVELLEAQQVTRQAHVRSAEVAVEAASRSLSRLERLNKAKQGAIVGRDEVEQAQTQLELAKAQLDIRKAEANELAVQLKQARRRVESLSAPPPPPTPPAAKAPVPLD